MTSHELPVSLSRYQTQAETRWGSFFTLSNSSSYESKNPCKKPFEDLLIRAVRSVLDCQERIEPTEAGTVAMPLEDATASQLRPATSSIRFFAGIIISILCRVAWEYMRPVLVRFLVHGERKAKRLAEQLQHDNIKGEGEGGGFSRAKGRLNINKLQRRCMRSPFSIICRGNCQQTEWIIPCWLRSVVVTSVFVK